MNVRNQSALQRTLSAIVVVGLAIDAIVHFDLASAYANVKTSTLSQADLFRVEAGAAILAAVAILVRPRRYTAAFAFAVAAAGFAAVVVYRYVDVGAFGPVPDMYDPYWLPTGKWLSAVAEAAAAAAAFSQFVIFHQHGRAVAPAEPNAVPVGG